MNKLRCLAFSTLFAIALLPTAALAQEQDPVQPLRAKIGVQATSLFDITDAASTPRLMLDDMGKLTIFGMIESTAGGITFPDGTTQITAATGGGGGLWTQEGSNIFYNVGNVGVGSVNSNANFNVRGESLGDNDLIFNIERLSGGTSNNVLSVSKSGEVGIWDVNPNVTLNVRNRGIGQEAVFNVEKADGANILTIKRDGDVGIGDVNVGVKLNVKNTESKPFAFNVEQADGDNLFRVRDAGTIDISGDVGIGTTTPAARLDVVARTGEPSIVTRDGNDYATVSGQDIDFGHWDGNAFTERMAISSAGTITAMGPLAVSNLIESTSGGFKFPDGTTQTTAATGGGGGLWTEDGSDIHYDAGSVGIGTTSPEGRLDVAAPSTIEPSIVTRGGKDYATASGQAIHFGHWDGTTSTFTERMVINPSGAVGIGGAAESLSMLNVRNDGFRYNIFDAQASDGTTLFRIANDGSVGIGTIGPGARLDVVAESAMQPSIVTRGGYDYAAGAGEQIEFGHWNGTTFSERVAINRFGDVGIGAVQNSVKLNVQNIDTRPLAFNVEQANGNNLFTVHHEGTIDISGDVGIGTTTPAARLDVAANGSEPSIVTRGGKDYATTSGQTIDFGHWNGTTFTPRMAINPTGNVGIGVVYTNTQLNVRNINSQNQVFRVERADASLLFLVHNDGAMSLGNASKFSKEGDLMLMGGAAPTIVLDHPLDPAEKQLRFTAVEAPDRYTFHSGTVVLNGSGAATVALPDWYEASNTDLRYQLTPIGAPGPNLYIARKVQNNRFEIAGGTAGMEVSWLLTATRSDAAARARPFEAEARKTGTDRGRYYTPEAHGQPASLRINPGDDADTIAQPFDN